MSGKMKCTVLKEIRQKIAEVNHIPFESPDCRNEDDCYGTCPQCEAEVRYLEKYLCNLERRGIETHVDGISGQIDFSDFNGLAYENTPEKAGRDEKVSFKPDGGIQFIPEDVLINGKKTDYLHGICGGFGEVKNPYPEENLMGIIHIRKEKSRLISRLF